MQTKPISRPWQKVKKYGNRTSIDPFYQSPAWNKIVDQIWIRDKSTCQLCLQQGKIHLLTRGTRDINKQGTVDHKVRRKQGGSDDSDNLWLIGTVHHQSKSAREGNQSRKKQ